MKKKIAVCGSGWSNEYLKTVMSGIRKCAEEKNTDVFVLMNYTITNAESYKESGEANVFRLLEYGGFDGVIILSNTLHTQEEYEYLCDVIEKKNLPAICLEYQLPGIDFIGTDNYSGMRELCEHLFHHHKIAKPVFVSGPIENTESSIRRKALEDVMHENGLELTEEQVIYCNWNYYEVTEKLPKWLQNNSGLPDVFVCANDVMAMAACEVLHSNNIRVPEDVLVTGFDCLESAMLYNPMIATVDRSWDDMGYRALEGLLQKIGESSLRISEFVSSKAVPAKSCGCELGKAYQTRQLKLGGVYNKIVNDAFWGGHLCDIAERLGKVISDEELHVSLVRFLQDDHKYEGSEVYICLVDSFFSSISGEAALPQKGYTDKVDVIAAVKDGIACPRCTINTSELIPGYDIGTEGGKVYTFVPFYSADGCFGYVAFGEELQMMYDYTLYNWVRNLTECFGHVRLNIVLADMNRKLEILSVTDGLTGVYNRMGCEKIAYPYLEKCHRAGKRAVLMFADINRMKRINDKFGHIQGDVAITTVAASIREVLTDSWIIVRYGGDEFLMVGECDQEEDATHLLKEIMQRMQEKATQMKLPYKLKVGLGFVFVEPHENLDLTDCLRRADEAMYEMKKITHKEN